MKFPFYALLCIAAVFTLAIALNEQAPSEAVARMHRVIIIALLFAIALKPKNI